MSPEGSVSGRIAFEIDQIKKELKVIEKLNAIRKSAALDEIQIRAGASSLHSIYNGIEKIMLDVLKDRGKPVPKGETWHSELLEMAQKSQIISKTLETELREFMGFRHFYRHTYGFMLDAELMNPLLDKIQAIMKKVANELGIDK